MAIKEEIAATAVAKFVLKPSVNEAQNLLRSAKIFTSKSIAKFAEQLSKAKAMYDAAVSKVKNTEVQADKSTALNNFSEQEKLPSDIENKYNNLIFLVEFNSESLTNMYFVNDINYDMAKKVRDIAPKSKLLSEFTKAYKTFINSPDKQAASGVELKALEDMDNLCQNKKKSLRRLKTKSSIIIERHELWIECLPTLNRLVELIHSDSNKDVFDLIFSPKEKGTDIFFIAEETIVKLRLIQQILTDNMVIFAKFKFTKEDKDVDIPLLMKIEISSKQLSFLTKPDFYLGKIDKFIKANQVFSEKAPDPKAPDGSNLSFVTCNIPEREEDLFKIGKGDTNAIDFNDIKQGAMGNCYFLASLMAIAQKQPNLIKDAIKINGKTGFKVKLFAQTPNGDGYESVYIYIDNTFLCDDKGTLHGAKKGDEGELWVMILEKAMAKLLGGYDRIDNGGNMAYILPLLTGKTPTKIEEKTAVEFETKVTTIVPMDEEQILKLFRNTDSQFITIGIKQSKAVNTTLYPKLVHSSADMITNNGSNIYCKHAYLITKVDLEKSLVTLRNPHNKYPDAEEDKKNGNVTNPVVTVRFIMDCTSSIVYG